MPVYFSRRSEIRLTDGTIVKTNADGEFLPLQDVITIHYACAVCPIRLFCQSNNEFDCQTYGMFSGFYFGLDDALDLMSVIDDDLASELYRRADVPKPEAR